MPYLRVPCYLHGDELRFAGAGIAPVDPVRRAVVERVFTGGASLEDLAETAVEAGASGDAAQVAARMATAFAAPESPIGLIELELLDAYDIIVVEQGYGGVYVHTVELLKQLRERWRCLLICPVEPLFESARMEDTLTLDRLRESQPGLSFFSYVHIMRTVVQRTRCKLLLISHRSHSLYLFDLLRDRNAVIYCDGYYDGAFRRVADFRIDDTPAARERTLSELYYLLAAGSPDYFGLSATPALNVEILTAGAFSLRDARENWCWGEQQRRHFAHAFPQAGETLRFEPPFTNPAMFRPELVQREQRVLFTTTMHNIDKKGLPELVRAMARLPSVRTRCVVRQPERLPPIPARVAARMEMGAVTKDEMVQLYHRMWLNCRVSREESSPLSILEAMICELPQIVSPVVAEQIPIIEDGVTGFVVDPDDRVGLVRALRTLLGDRRLRDRMGRECRQRASSYSFANRVAVFERLLA